MKSSAFVVGPHNAARHAICRSLIQTGFSSIYHYSRLSAVEQALSVAPSCFMLFAPVDDIGVLADVVKPLRRCKRRNARFMPLIYFCTVSSREVVRAAIAMGFDDVIAMPYKQDDFSERLMRLMNRIDTYCEAGDYFGPTRDPQRPGAAAGGKIAYPARPEGRLIRFVRSFSAGVNIIGDPRRLA